MNEKRVPPARKSLKEYASDAAARLKKSPSGIAQPKFVKKKSPTSPNRGK